MENAACTQDDTQLVADIQRGDAAAEAALYHRYSSRVYYLAVAELRCREQAEDARSETFLRVLQSIRAGRLRSAEALPSFVLSTTHNVVREFRRDERRVEPLADRDPEDDWKPADSHVQQAIEKVIRRLKPREREFLRMYYYEELPNEEIARRLGIKEERLRLIKSRALKRFREIYQRI